MKIRKIILAVLIVFALSFSFQPVTSYTQMKDSIVLTIDAESDYTIKNFIEKNKNKTFSRYISLSFQCSLAYAGSFSYNNTS